MLSTGIFSHFSLDSYLNFFVNKSHHGDNRYFHEISTFFSFGEQFFEDQIRRPGIRTAPHNPYAGHKLLCRGPHLAHGPPVRQPRCRC